MNSSYALQSVSEATHAFEQFLKCKFIAPPFEIVNLMVKIAVYAWTRWFMLEPEIKNSLFMDERKETWTWHWKLKWAQKLSYSNEHQQDKEKKEDVTLWLCQSTLVANTGYHFWINLWTWQGSVILLCSMYRLLTGSYCLHFLKINSLKLELRIKVPCSIRTAKTPSKS